MEYEGLLQFSQEFATGPYPEPDDSSMCSSVLFSKIHPNIIFWAIILYF
jgi:hypothetical protein